jgi:hypothetical protein
MAAEAVIVRFVLTLPTEEPAFVDIPFADERQAKSAMTTVMRSQGQLVELKNASNVPVLIRSDQVAAAFLAEFDDDDDDNDNEDADEKEDADADAKEDEK